MPKSEFDFTFKFFRPPQRTVAVRNGLLDIRTKHIIAQDRHIVAEQRILDAERRKSASNIQLLAFEQKQLEKKLTSLYNNFSTTAHNQPIQTRGRSTSEVILRNIRRSSSWADTLPIYHSKLSVSLRDSNQNRLSLPKLDDIRRSSLWADTLPIYHSKLSVSLRDSNQNRLSLPKLDDIQRRFSGYSDGDTPENPFFISDNESGDEGGNWKSDSKLHSPKKIAIKKKTFPKLGDKHKKKPLPPIVAIIPPEEETGLFLTQ